jgi:hypothetical protein
MEKRRKKHARFTYQAKSLPLQREFGCVVDRWNELKEVLRIQIRAEVAKILLDR